ncbi:MAG: 1-acyl-sn-glycerol-3-phosphate acyltransferase [Oscillospiraceae bacterium]|nr:1-acyl-sn-glycerol-3-phosphate acyltransferase [Oscillospiraceae bacterium]
MSQKKEQKKIQKEIIEKEAFQVIGRRRATPRAGGAWDIARTDGSLARIEGLASGEPLLGLCFGFGESGANDYMVGAEAAQDAPGTEGLERFAYPAGPWLVVTAEGKLSENTLAEAWKAVHKKILRKSARVQAPLPTMERYLAWEEQNDYCKVEIWIPVKKGEFHSKKYNFDRLDPYPSFQYFWIYLGRFLARLMFRIKAEGLENLPESSAGIILACNHTHALDPAFLAVTSKKLAWRFIAKIELFRNPFVAWLFTQCNGFPINREIIDRRAMDFAVNVMKDGRMGLGVFPEGRRSPDGKIHEARGGTAMFARMAKADILPCCIYREGDLKFRCHITVRYGELIPFGELGLGERPNKRETQAATEKIMDAITALWKLGF